MKKLFIAAIIALGSFASISYINAQEPCNEPQPCTPECTTTAPTNEPCNVPVCPEENVPCDTVPCTPAPCNPGC